MKNRIPFQFLGGIVFESLAIFFVLTDKLDLAAVMMLVGYVPIGIGWWGLYNLYRKI